MEFEDYKFENLESLIKAFLKEMEYLKFEEFCYQSFLESKRRRDLLIWEGDCGVD